MYTRTNPLLARLKSRQLLSSPDSSKRTLHLVLDIEGSGLTYQPGDTVGVLPENHPDIIDQLLSHLFWTGEERITDRRSGEERLLRLHLSKQTNLAIVKKSLVESVYAELPHEAPSREKLHQLLNAQEADFKSHLSTRHLLDFLEEHPEFRPNPEQLCTHLQPLLPKFYSIASSQKKVGEEIHLTVAHVTYELKGKVRYGVGSHWLCELVKEMEESVPLFIQKAHKFALPPSHDTPIIMIGPGTGVAPFRSFLQERIASGATGAHWLFFGDRHKHHDFLYREEFEEMVRNKHLNLETAFSRDQKEKIYVQHRLMEQSKTLFDLLENGAYLYLCGNKDPMSYDVEATLLQIFMKEGNLDKDNAKAYLTKLIKSGRYMKDVY